MPAVPSIRRAGACLLAAAALVASACGRDAGPAALRPVTQLKPLAAGVYRMIGNEKDSRELDSRELVETYEVEPAFSRDGNRHQVTHLDDPGERGESTSWEVSLRPTGAFRLRETVGEVSWTWEPPLQTMTLPIQVGRSWSSTSKALIGDQEGLRRETTVSVKGRVDSTTTVVVAGRVLRTYVIDTTIVTNGKDTVRASGSSRTFVVERTTRSWFSPDHARTVKSFSSAKFTNEVDEFDRETYTISRSLRLEAL